MRVDRFASGYLETGMGWRFVSAPFFVSGGPVAARRAGEDQHVDLMRARGLAGFGAGGEGGARGQHVVHEQDAAALDAPAGAGADGEGAGDVCMALAPGSAFLRAGRATIAISRASSPA